MLDAFTGLPVPEDGSPGEFIDVGWGDDQGMESDYQRIREAVNAELKRAFKPEFLNRLDDVIVFHPLNRTQVDDIAGIMLEDISRRLRERGIALTVTPAFRDLLVTRGFNPTYGARPLRRVINSMLEDILAECILRKKLQSSDAATVDVDEGGDGVVVRDAAGATLLTSRLAALAPGIG